jgi:hypothetical protein
VRAGGCPFEQLFPYRNRQSVPDGQDRGEKILRLIEQAVEFEDGFRLAVGWMFVRDAAAPKDVVRDE